MSLSKMKYTIDFNTFNLSDVEKYIDILENKENKGYLLFIDSNNSDCILSENLLKKYSIKDIEFVNLKNNLDKEYLYNYVNNKYNFKNNNQVNTLPQIFKNEIYIGGYNELYNHCIKNF